MKKKFYLTSFFIIFLLFVFSYKISFAAPANNPLFATIEFVQAKINDLYDQLDLRIGNNELKISELEEKIDNNEETNSNNSVDFVFIEGQIPTSGFNSSIFDAVGYNKLVFSFNTPSLPNSTGGVGINLMVSANGNDWFIQDSWSENIRNFSKTYDVAGRYYMVSSNSTTLQAVAVNAFGHFYNSYSGNQIIGAMPDANSPQLGLINFSGNKEKYEFWFTPDTSVLDYITGHTYRVIYQVSVESPDDWCGQTPVVNRPPYNLFGVTPGNLVYYKIHDITSGTTPCF